MIDCVCLAKPGDGPPEEVIVQANAHAAPEASQTAHQTSSSRQQCGVEHLQFQEQ